MAHLTLDIYSDALHKATQVEVIMPQYRAKNENSGPYRCLYLLHGASDNHTSWMRRTAIERYAEDDLFHLAEICPQRPRIYMASGDCDRHTPANRKLSQHLHELGFDHCYIEPPGDHTWDFWDDQIQQALKWMMPAEK